MFSRNIFEEESDDDILLEMLKKKKKKKEKKIKLPPNELFYLPNADKKTAEKWYKGRNLMNIPKPCRVILCGNPGSGKSNMIKNLILRADPPYEKIYLLHPDEDSCEYDDIGSENIERLSEVPKITFCDPKVKNLLIVDDIELKNLKKDAKGRLDRLCGYSSSHRNLSVFMTSQDTFNIPPSIRRNGSFFCLWKNQPDISALAQVASRSGLNSQKLFNIFENHMENNRDCLMIDMTPNTPAPLRVNGYKVIEKEI